PVRGAGRAGGFAFVIEDRGDLGPHKLQKQIETLVGTAAQEKDLVGVFSVFRANVPQLKVDVDKDQCLKRNVRVDDVGQMLQVYQGSLYVNDFNLFDRTWQVIVQADARHRVEPEQLKRLKTRN